MRAEEALRDSEAKYGAIVNAINQMIWSTRPDGFHDYFNERWYEFTGAPAGSTDGDGWNDMFHPDDREAAWAAWRHCLATGEPYHIEYRLRHRSGQYRWVIGRAQCMRGPDGAITRWFGTCTDIDDIKRAEEKRLLLLREMNHRVKNLFSIASGMITMTARNAPSVPAMAETLRGRLTALARAHELIRSAIRDDVAHPESVELRQLMEEVLTPHLDPENSQQLVLVGPQVYLGSNASTSCALIFHELATNATKYGALSGPGGTIRIEWSLDRENLELVWQETVEGKEVTRPTTKGFGSKLAHSAATGQLGGAISFDWRPHGVEIRLRARIGQLER